MHANGRLTPNAYLFIAIHAHQGGTAIGKAFFFMISDFFYRAGRAHSHIELGEAGIGRPNLVQFQLKDKRIFINLARGER
jgi:hypothetical protein